MEETNEILSVANIMCLQEYTCRRGALETGETGVNR